MNNTMYAVFNYNELIDKINKSEIINTDVNEFFNTFTFNTIINQQIAKGESGAVFRNAIKEDTIKSKIIQLLNKLNAQNITKIISSVREIHFNSIEELNELVFQCIQKIKRDNEQIRPLVAVLCWEFLLLHFVTSENEKIYFKKLLLTEVKKEYLSSINYDLEDWSKDKTDKSMILIGTLFNNKVIEQKIMNEIINDFKKIIEYRENGSQEDYENVEKCLQQLKCLVSSVVLNSENKIVFDGLDDFLEKNINIYEEKKCIQKKIRLVCKNTIDELRKNKL